MRVVHSAMLVAGGVEGGLPLGLASGEKPGSSKHEELEVLRWCACSGEETLVML